MTVRIRVAVIAAMTAFCLPALAAGQQPSVDSLRRRIDSLERRAADLERRVGALEALIRTEPSQERSLPTASKWQNLANWRRLRVGMSMDGVRALLGEPERVNALGVGTFWYWAEGQGVTDTYVLFDPRTGMVRGWSEPGR